MQRSVTCFAEASAGVSASLPEAVIDCEAAGPPV